MGISGSLGREKLVVWTELNLEIGEKGLRIKSRSIEVCN